MTTTYLLPNTTECGRAFAARIAAAADEAGLTVRTVSDGADHAVEVYGSFTPGDLAAYMALLGAAERIVYHFHGVRPGSVYGSTLRSGSTAALHAGEFYIGRSGVSANQVKAVRRHLGY